MASEFRQEKIALAAFDVYGTLLDTSSITEAIQKHLGVIPDVASKISGSWRKHQLEYTWRLNSMGYYESFDVVTKKSLFNATAEHGIRIDETMAASLLEAYHRLDPFGDTLPALQGLAELPHVKVIIFSNGTQKMVTTALQSTGTSLSSLPDGMYFADSVSRYKPAPEIYHGLVSYLNNSTHDIYQPSNVWLVSGNPFDVTGARSAGLSAFWIDRSGTGWLDRISPDGHDLTPNKVIKDLREITDFLTPRETE